MPLLDEGWLITPKELDDWLVAAWPGFAAFNKPGGVVCHPSRSGPWTSLAGACREHFGLERVHMPTRLDRETSGAVIIAMDAQTASQLQRCAATRRVRKRYLALVEGVMDGDRLVDEPIGMASCSAVHVKRAVVPSGLPALTRFRPLQTDGRWTLVEIEPETGRTHQIRVHAAAIGHPIVADKIYGASEEFYLQFTKEGWSPSLARRLPFRRHALHSASIEFALPGWTLRVDCPLPPELFEWRSPAP